MSDWKKLIITLHFLAVASGVLAWARFGLLTATGKSYDLVAIPIERDAQAQPSGIDAAWQGIQVAQGGHPNRYPTQAEIIEGRILPAKK